MDLQQLLDALNHQTRKVNELRAENERLRTVLQSVEYVEDADGVWWCPSCKVCHHDHSDNCQLKAALDAAGE